MLLRQLTAMITTQTSAASGTASYRAGVMLRDQLVELGMEALLAEQVWSRMSIDLSPTFFGTTPQEAEEAEALVFATSGAIMTLYDQLNKDTIEPREMLLQMASRMTFSFSE